MCSSGCYKQAMLTKPDDLEKADITSITHTIDFSKKIVGLNNKPLPAASLTTDPELTGDMELEVNTELTIDGGEELKSSVGFAEMGTKPVALEQISTTERRGILAQLKDEISQFPIPIDEKIQNMWLISTEIKTLRIEVAHKLEKFFTDASLDQDALNGHALAIIRNIEPNIRKIVTNSFLSQFDNKLIETVIRTVTFDEERQAKKTIRDLRQQIHLVKIHR